MLAYPQEESIVLSHDAVQQKVLLAVPHLRGKEVYWRRSSFDLSATIVSPHIRNTPNFVSGIGALSVAEKHSASTRRVSAGAMMPSSQSRAVA